MSRPHRLPRLLGCFCLALAVGSCGDDFTGTTGNLQIVLTEGSLEFPLLVVPGQSANTTVELVRPRGFTGPVQVTASPLPAGVTTEAITIGMGQRAGGLSFQAALEAAQATSIVTVRATGDDVNPAQVILGLRVSEPPSLTLSLAGESVSLVQGDTASVGVTLTRTHLPGTINLTATGAPSGLSVQFSPAAVITNASLIRLAAAATQSPGTYTVTIRASAEGVADQTATLNVILIESASVAVR